MKSLFVLTITLFSAASLAMPAVGDWSNFVGTSAKSGKTLNFTLDLEISNHKKSSNSWLITSIIKYNAQVETKSDWRPFDDMMTDQKVHLILQNCPQAGGVMEPIQTPAGLISTCKLPNQNMHIGNINANGYVWLGHVPFGFAKVEGIDDKGVFTRLELQRYSFGN